jgi:prepilin signal peptidase PulO-like enzyme (type II secretory pathway)
VAGAILVILVAGALYASWAHSDLSLLQSAAGGALSVGVLLLALAIVRLRSGLSGLGNGDLLLGGAAGFWTGIGGVGYALLIAVALTGAYGVLRKAKPTTRLPFAPGLVSGFALVAIVQELS